MIAVLAALAFQCPDGSPPPCRVPRVAPVNPSSVAVLYFDNLSHDTADAALAEGLTEELIIRLSQVERLEVKSRYESRRVRGAADDPRAIGRTLRAAYLVSGSLQQAGTRIRLSVSLIRAATGAQVWGDVFDKVGEDALTVQSEVAREVTGAITGRLLPAERATLTRRPRAMRWRTICTCAAWARRTGPAKRNPGRKSAPRPGDRARLLVRRRLGAPGLGLALAGRRLHGCAEGVRSRPRSRQPRIAAGLIAGAGVGGAQRPAQALDFDHAATMAFARRAVAANPRDPDARSTLAEAFEFDHQFADGAREHRLAFADDTLSASTAWIYISFLNRAGMIDSMAAVLPHTRGALSPLDIQHWEGLLKLRRGDAAGAARQLTWRYYGGAFAGYYAAALLAAAGAMRRSLCGDSVLNSEPRLLQLLRHRRGVRRARRRRPRLRDARPRLRRADRLAVRRHGGSGVRAAARRSTVRGARAPRVGFTS